MDKLPKYLIDGIKYVKKHEKELRKKYGDDYIFVPEDISTNNYEHFDHDSDVEKLAKRVGDKKGLIQRIDDIVNPRVVIVSPKVLEDIK